MSNLVLIFCTRKSPKQNDSPPKIVKAQKLKQLSPEKSSFKDQSSLKDITIA